MITTVDLETAVTLTPKNLAEEILQNVKVIVTTVLGEVPLDRKFGINNNIMDLPASVGESKLLVAILESIQDFEPRAEVVKIELQENLKNAEKGIFSPKIEVKIKDEYINQ